MAYKIKRLSKVRQERILSKTYSWKADLTKKEVQGIFGKEKGSYYWKNRYKGVARYNNLPYEDKIALSNYMRKKGLFR